MSDGYFVGEEQERKRIRRTVPCLRCGRRVQPGKSPDGVICQDCRCSDPDYVRAIKTGQKIVA